MLFVQTVFKNHTGFFRCWKQDRFLGKWIRYDRMTKNARSEGPGKAFLIFGLRSYHVPSHLQCKLWWSKVSKNTDTLRSGWDVLVISGSTFFDVLTYCRANLSECHFSVSGSYLMPGHRLKYSDFPAEGFCIPRRKSVVLDASQKARTIFRIAFRCQSLKMWVLVQNKLFARGRSARKASSWTQVKEPQKNHRIYDRFFQDRKLS